MKSLKNMKNAKITRNMALTTWILIIIVFVISLFTFIGLVTGSPLFINSTTLIFTGFTIAISVISTLLTITLLVVAVIMLIFSIKMIKNVKGRVLAIVTSSILLGYFALSIIIKILNQTVLQNKLNSIEFILTLIYIAVFILAIITWTSLKEQSNSEEVIMVEKNDDLQNNNNLSNLESELKKIDDLLANKIITKEEHAKLRSKILNI